MNRRFFVAGGTFLRRAGKDSLYMAIFTGQGGMCSIQGENPVMVEVSQAIPAVVAGQAGRAK
jgi:hypothetical protein